MGSVWAAKLATYQLMQRTILSTLLRVFGSANLFPKNGSTLLICLSGRL